MKSNTLVTRVGLIALLILAACHRKVDSAILVKVTATTATLPTCVQLTVRDASGAIQGSPVLTPATANGTYIAIRHAELPGTINVQAELFSGPGCTDVGALKLISRGSGTYAFPEQDVTEVSLEVGPPDTSLDADRDGYVDVGRNGVDCNDQSAAIHPGAAQDCASTTDTDCNGTAGCMDPACSTASVCSKRIAFSPASLTPESGTCVPATLQLIDGASMPATTTTALTFTLNTDTAALGAFSDAACGTSIAAVTIAANTGSVGLFVKSTQVGSATHLTAKLSTDASINATLTVTATEAPVASIHFVGDPVTLTAGACGAPVIIEALDSRGQPTRPTQMLNIALAASPSTQFEFFNGSCSALDGGTPGISQVLMPAGQSQVSLRLRAKLAGAYTVTADANKGTPPTLAVTVTAGPASRLVLSPAVVALIRNTCSSGTITVSTTDDFDNPAVPAADVPVTFTSTPSTGLSVFAGSDTACATTAPTITVPASSGSAQLHLKASVAQQFTLTPATTTMGITGVPRQVSVSNDPPSALQLTDLTSQVTAGQCSGAVRFQSVDGTNVASPVAANTPIALNSSGTNVAFFASGNCTDGGALQITAGNAQAVFSYLTPVAQSFTVGLTAPGGGLTPPAGPHSATVTPGAPAKLVWDAGVPTGNAGDCIAMTFRSFDTANNLSALPADSGVTFTSIDAGLLFSRNANCAGASGSIVLPASLSTVPVFATTTQAGTYAATATVPALGISTTTPTPVQVDIGPATQLALLNTPATLASGSCTTLTVERRNLGGTPVTAAGAINVTLSTSADGGTVDIVGNTGSCRARPLASNALQIAAGASSTVVSIRGTRVGQVSLSATSMPLTAAAATTQVTPGDASNLTMDSLSAPSFTAGACVPFTVRMTDVNGNLAGNVPANTQLTLFGTSSGSLAPQFFTDATCATAISAPITATQVVTTLYFRPRSVTAAGGTTVSAAASNLSGNPQVSFAVTAGAGTQVVITSSAFSAIPVNGCQAGTWGVVDAFGNATAAPAGGLAYTLSSTSATASFFVDGVCGSAGTSGSASAGTTSGTFSVRNNTIESFSVTLSTGAQTSSQMWATVFAQATHLVFKTPPTSPQAVGGCVSAVLEVQDVNNAPVTLSNSYQLNLTLSSNQTKVFFYSDSGCTSAISGPVTVSSGSQVTVYLLPMVTGVSVTVSATGSIVSPATTLSPDPSFTLALNGTAPALSVAYPVTNNIEAGACQAVNVERRVAGQLFTRPFTTTAAVALGSGTGIRLFSDAQCTTPLPGTVSLTQATTALYARGDSGAGTPASGISVTATDQASIFSTGTGTLIPLPLVRRGTCAIASGDTTVTCSTAQGSTPGILPASLSRSFVVFQGTHGSDPVDDATAECHLVPGASSGQPLQVSCSRQNSNGALSIAWQTATWGRAAFEGGVSVQHLSASIVPQSSPMFFTLDAGVDAASSFVFVSTASAGPASANDQNVDINDFMAANLVSSNSVWLNTTNIGADAGLDHLNYAIQVVSMSGASVSRSWVFAADGGAATVALPIDAGVPSFALSTVQVASADPTSFLCDRAFSLTTDSDYVTLSRGNGSTSVDCIGSPIVGVATERVALPASTSVQQVAFDIGNSPVTVTLNAIVDPTRTLLLSGSQGPNGQGWGELGHSNTARPGAAIAQLVLTSGTTFTATRGNNSDTAHFNVYVVQFAP